MTATFASSSWPAPTLSAWRFGIESSAGLQWVLRRNCSIEPRQLLAVYLSLCTLSLLIGGVFWWQGATLILPFAWIEVIAVGIALLAYARHAADREEITLDGDMLRVEHRCGSTVERAEFRAAWVRVEPVHGEGSLLDVSGQGRSVQVGRYVRPELRGALAQELRRAVRALAGGLPARTAG